MTFRLISNLQFNIKYILNEEFNMKINVINQNHIKYFRINMKLWKTQN